MAVALPEILNFFYLNPLQFANQMGLYALLSIIPLIIIYLLRPRPLKIKIPSLMFLMDMEKKKRLNVFRKFLKDPLFLIQLLVLLLLSFAVAEPFIMTDEEVGGGHTVIILDASASMQADGKFEKAAAEADKFLSSRNTVILAQSVPVMVMTEAPQGSAGDALGKLKAKATGADLSSAILLGRRMLPEGGRMVVFSDFSSWSGENPNVARSLAQANGINVEFITITGRTDNIGIVDGWFEPGGDYKIIVRNFNTDRKNVGISVTTNNRNVLSSTLDLNTGSSEYFVISDLQPGNTEIRIDTDDALAVDNTAYVLIPDSITRDVLYITGNEITPSLIALDLNRFTTTTRVDAAGIPSLSGYAAVIVSSSLSPGDTDKLREYVRGGGNAVIIAHPGLERMDLLPVVLGSVSNRTSLNVVTPGRMTEGIDIGKVVVNKHFMSSLKSGAVAFVEGGDSSVMLAYWRYGSGLVIYSGLADPAGDNIYDPLNEDIWNDFHILPEYPLFWKQVLEWISGSLDISEYNAKTGTFIRLPAVQTVKTPDDTVTTDLLYLDEVGSYSLPGKEIAVNLFDERESNLEGQEMEVSNGGEEVQYNIEVRRAPKYLDIYLIIAGMFFIFFELYYLRWRGEL
ncbi:MAG: BatA domain-containing protein [Candidatus Methanoperedens sp.]